MYMNEQMNGMSFILHIVWRVFFYLLFMNDMSSAGRPGFVTLLD
jgi:hypothetical protein